MVNICCNLPEQPWIHTHINVQPPPPPPTTTPLQLWVENNQNTSQCLCGLTILEDMQNPERLRFAQQFPM
jgi:hypothetical protein